MLNKIVVALWLTMLFAFFIESIKVKLAYNKVQYVNKLLEHRMMKLLADASDINVFKVSEVRKALFEEFVKPHIVDELELYKVDAHNLHMKYKKLQADAHGRIVCPAKAQPSTSGNRTMLLSRYNNIHLLSVSDLYTTSKGILCGDKSQIYYYDNDHLNDAGILLAKERFTKIINKYYN